MIPHLTPDQFIALLNVYQKQPVVGTILRDLKKIDYIVKTEGSWIVTEAGKQRIKLALQ